MTTILALDCSVTGLGVAVLGGGKRLAVVGEEGRDQAARLLPAIETALANAGVDRRAVSLLAVTIGPGSFTGVRVGLATARGLALGLGVPLAGIATTTVLLAQSRGGPPAGAAGQRRLAVAAIDSRLGDWFCALDDGERTPFLTTAAALAAQLAGRACLIAGVGAGQLAAALVAAGVDAVAEEAQPDPLTLGRLAGEAGVEAWRDGNARDGLPRPLYLRGVNITLPDGTRRTVD
ncbi:tRNA (adenosine(37)-N6)-threonylcarbamoyltransferase complex dimerization subunit type 1 TsaB [Reyranella sp.]|uniref:tRNA (adenosine(37)-N6)-threonylcarbamoyltransferase complex dimerization subunit type 1 TsaB n=1 Tax=Reyranella sp. TaxID=1929291 RepID=UPI0037843CD3